ncbi:MAG: N-acetyl-gamma-glutamyl-phosphate reductase [Candidatus Altiarchaeota archaeon]|nr:N-acetyl-gamma-glutamyl-phosphate reductase [Candidatus Altiarchaeota archaeon]
MKATIVGGSGYTGSELLRMLLRHSKVDEVTATSRTHAGKPVSDVHQNLKGIYEGKFEDYIEDKIDADIIFLAVPHGESMKAAPKLLARGMKVIDLGADYRIKDAALYERYYKVKHDSPDLLEKAVYGLPEMNRRDIKKANLVANPGCFVTAALLSLLPLSQLKDKIDVKKIVVDSNTGTSGAGATPSEFTHHSEVGENLKPYNVVGHRHQPEIEHIINRVIDGAKISFTPTLVPIVRGILSRTHVFGDVGNVNMMEHYARFYAKEPFIRMSELPYVKNVAYTNYCDVGAHYDKENKRVLAIAAIDNLVKGASGQAVQNMNLMLGFDETEGLRIIPAHP